MDEKTFTVAEISERIAASLRTALPGEIWVKGEIRDLTRPSSGHVYFSLVDGTQDGDAAGLLPVTLFARDRRVVNRLLVRSGAIRMVDGVEVWILFRNMSDVSTVDLRANPSSALDKIMNPNDRDAALATNYTGLTCKGQVWRFVLKITNEVDPLWFCEGVEEKL